MLDTISTVNIFQVWCLKDIKSCLEIPTREENRAHAHSRHILICIGRWLKKDYFNCRVISALDIIFKYGLHLFYSLWIVTYEKCKRWFKHKYQTHWRLCGYIWFYSDFKESYNNEAFLMSRNLLNRTVHKNKCLLFELNPFLTLKSHLHVSVLLFSSLDFPIDTLGDISLA